MTAVKLTDKDAEVLYHRLGADHSIIDSLAEQHDIDEDVMYDWDDAYTAIEQVRYAVDNRNLYNLPPLAREVLEECVKGATFVPANESTREEAATKLVKAAEAKHGYDANALGQTLARLDRADIAQARAAARKVSEYLGKRVEIPVS